MFEGYCFFQKILVKNGDKNFPVTAEAHAQAHGPGIDIMRMSMNPELISRM
jgi:hypothetical protein